jgi:type VI secretion system protein ImpA
MSAFDLAKILEPVSSDRPCGSDLEYDPEFLAMVQAATPKPERQMGAEIVPAEEPDWRAVKAAAVRLCTRSKDLRVLVQLCRAAVHTDGIDGLRQGLAALREVVQTYWTGLYPALDADDANDPTIRVNVLAALAEGTGLVRGVREAPIVVGRVAGSFGLHQLDAAAGRGTVAGTAPTPELVRAAFQEADVKQLEATATAVRASRDELAGLERALADKLGSSAPDLRPLGAVLHAQLRELEPQLAARGSALGATAAAAGGAEAAPGSGGHAPAAPSTGVNSREDVITWLDRICEFYARSEPSSPVPILLQRARRLVNKSFLDVVRDLMPDGLNQAMLYHGQEGSS